MGQPVARRYSRSDRLRLSYLTAASGQTARFRAFCPTFAGTARWWDVSVSAVSDGQGDHVGYMAISRDATESELAREALDIASKELRHRLSNTYTMISSLIQSFARGNSVYSEFAEDMSERLAALGRAQALFASGDAPCQLDELVRALVSSFANSQCAINLQDVPGLEIQQAQADAIALVLGELAVNASKYGAITHGGRIGVSARIDENGLKIHWQETSSAAVRAQSRESGQGIKLMQRIMKLRGGSLIMEWHEYGVDAVMRFG